MIDNEVMLSCYSANVAALGRPTVEPDDEVAVVGSTDMGNVSYVVPSIHPMIAAATLGTPIHTPDFAAAARPSSGDDAVVDGAVSIRWTVADPWAGECALAP